MKELLARVQDQVRHLVQTEIALAKAEMARKAQAAGIGAGLLVGAALVGFYASLVLVAAAVLGLAEAVPAWAAALIVGGALLLLAGVLAGVGVARLRRGVPPAPEKAIANLRLDLDAARKGLHR